MRNKNRENTCQRKTIIRTRQYLHGSTICLHPWSCKNYQGKKNKVWLQCFHTLSRRRQYNKTLITKNGFYILHIGFTMGYKTSQNFFLGTTYRPKSPLHGLSLKKSPIKKPRNIIQVGSATGSNIN